MSEQTQGVEIPPRGLAELPLTDAGNAERLILLYGDRVRYIPTWKSFRVFTGKIWEDGAELMMRLQRETMRATYRRAAYEINQGKDNPDPEVRKRIAAEAGVLAKFAAASESTTALNRAIAQVASFEAVQATPALFQPKPWVVAFLNGVWDRGVWRLHRKDDYLEHLMPVAYDPNADRSDWSELLRRMVGGDEDLARTLQDVAGYTLSGASSMRLIPWLYGPPGTGKGTLCELLKAMMGTTGTTLDRKLVHEDAQDEAIGRAVRGKRVAFLNEMGHKRVSSETLKTLSGGDTIPCRNLYANATYDVAPTWVVFATSNDAPLVVAYDEALRDRIFALPLQHRLDAEGNLPFTGGERIETYRRRTDTALATGFTAWSVEGLDRVYATQCIYRAEAALEQTRSFWEDADPLTPFWQQPELAAQLATEQGIAAAALHGAYLSWCDEQKIGRRLQGKTWASACRASGLEEKRRGAGVFWRRWGDSPLRIETTPM